MGGGNYCVHFFQLLRARIEERTLCWLESILMMSTANLTTLYCNVATNMTTTELKDLYYRFHHKLDVSCIIEGDLFGHHLEANHEVRGSVTKEMSMSCIALNSFIPYCCHGRLPLPTGDISSARIQSWEISSRVWTCILC